MKSNYESSVLAVLERFEKNSEKQNVRIDTAHHSHLDSLKNNYDQQLIDKNNTIDYLKTEIDFYKQQFTQQQKILENLNNRYDTVMHGLMSDKKPEKNIKDIFDNGDFELNYQPEILTSNQSESAAEIDLESLYQEAMNYRENGETQRSFLIFKQAAQNGEVRSMGALARAYFLNEGVEENQLMGLAWLINAAELEHQPAKKRCLEFKQTSPDLYQQALVTASELKQQTSLA
ncbi:MAG: hypothetical protein ACSHW0_12300 [Thalassotalea sp.]